MYKNHFGGVLAFGVLTVVSLTLLYGAEPGRELVQVNQSLAAEAEAPVGSIRTEEPQIALTFNGTGAGEDPSGILDILEENGAGAAFFVTGEWVECYPEETKAILKAGHDLGSMGETYADLRRLSEADREEELLALHNQVAELTGYEMFLFRPPFGRYDGQVLQCAENMGYVTVLGNTDSMDWKGYGPDAAAGAVLAAENGSIVIFRLGAPDTEEALKMVLQELRDRGCAVRSLSQMGIGAHCTE